MYFCFNIHLKYLQHTCIEHKQCTCAEKKTLKSQKVKIVKKWHVKTQMCDEVQLCQTQLRDIKAQNKK